MTLLHETGSHIHWKEVRELVVGEWCGGGASGEEHRPPPSPRALADAWVLTTALPLLLCASAPHLKRRAWPQVMSPGFYFITALTC